MKKILIFDDRPALREILAERLTLEGHVTISIGGAESLALCAERFEPDLAILGLNDRGKILWDLLGNLKCQYPSLPILLLPSFKHLEPARIKEADAQAQNTFPLEEFTQEVRTLLEQPKTAPATPLPYLAEDSNQIGMPDSFRPVALPCAH